MLHNTLLRLIKVEINLLIPFLIKYCVGVAGRRLAKADRIWFGVHVI